MAMDHDSVVIQTPEYVEIEYELAGLGSRFVACMLDSLVQTAISVVIAILMLYVLQGEVSLGAQGTPVDLFIYVVIGLLGLLLSVGYWVASEMLTGGRSIGKIAAGLRVIRDDGTAISFWDSLLRNLLRTVDMLPGSYLVGIISIWVSSKSKRVGDYAAGTIVVKERRAELPEVIAPPPTAVAAPRPESPLHDLVRPHARRLTAEQAQAARRLLERRAELEPTVRVNLARRLAVQMAGQLAIPLTDLRAAEQFLQAVVDCHDEVNRSKL